MDPFTLIYLVGGFALSLLAEIIKPKPKPSGIRGSRTSGENEPLSFIVGPYGTAGHWEYGGTWGNSGDVPNAYLTDVVSVSDIPVRGLRRLFVDGAACSLGTHAANGYPVLEYRKGGKDHLWVEFFDGTQTTADAFLLSKFGTHPEHPFLSDMIGRGIAYARMTALVNPDLFNGLPDYFFEIDGVELDDPRGDDEQENPVVEIRQALSGFYFGDEWVWGLQDLPASRLPSSIWEPQMDKCDVDVDKVGGTEKRFRAGAEIKVDQQPIDVIAELLESCNGRMAEIGGIYKILVAEPDAPVKSFTDEDFVISEPQNYEPFPGLEATYNAVNATYVEPEERWGVKAAPALRNADYVDADDGRELPADVSFPMVFSGTQAQRLMSALLEENRRFRNHTGTMPPEWFEYEPLDAVEWTSERNGYTSKAFLITAQDDLPNANQFAAWREQDGSEYDWDAEEDEQDSEIIALAVERPEPVAMSGWSVAPYTFPDGDALGRRFGIEVEFAGERVDVVAVRIQIKEDFGGEATVFDSGATPYDVTEADPVARVIAGAFLIPDQDYEVRGKFILQSGREADWSDWLSVTTPNVGLKAADIDEVDASSVIGELIASQIADAAITANKLATDAVTAVKIAAGAVEAAKIAVAAVTSAAIDTGAVIAAKIGAGAVTTAKIAADAVTATELAANAVDAAAIQTGAVLTAKIAALAVTSAELNTAAVVTAKIAALAVTTAELGNDAVTSAKILANTIVAGDIAASTITSSEIAANTIVAADIAAGTITTTEIAANTIVAADIAAGTITTTQIASATIVAGNIASGTITATQIAANTITSAKMVAGSITARELVVADYSNMAPDSYFTTVTTGLTPNASGSSVWSSGGNAPPTASTSSGVMGGRYMLFPAGTASSFLVGAMSNAPQRVPVEPSKSYTFGITADVAGATGFMRFDVNWYNGANTYHSTVTLIGPLLAGPNSAIAAAPAGVGFAEVSILRVGTGASSVETGSFAVYNLFIRKTADANLIVDGAITSVKILANTIVAADIAAGTITTTEIAAGTIVAANIAAGTITATQIAANTITSAKMVAGSITARELILTDYTNIMQDPYLTTCTIGATPAAAGSNQWASSGPAQPTVAASTGVAGGRYFNFPAGTASSFLVGYAGYVQRVPVQSGKAYTVGATMDAGGTGSMRLDVDWYNGSNVYLSTTVAIGSMAAGANAAIVTAPAGAGYAGVGILRVGTGASSVETGSFNIYNMFMRKAAEANLIVDGAITAAKVTAGTVTADLLVVGGKVITAHVTNNNITVVGADIAAADVAITTSTYAVVTWVQVATVTVVPNGGQTVVQAQALLRSSLTHPDAFGACEARLKRDGVVILTLTGYYDDFGTNQHPLTILPFWYQDTVAQTTSHTYVLEARNANTVDGLYLEAAAGSGIVATNFKK